MPPVTLEGDTLGKRRQHFNKLVNDAIANKHYELCNINGDDSDIDNLLRIDIACKTRNVDYIIQVLKSNDMLYAATAIKKSTWLITEQQYANIINPEYLHTQLLPSMNTKTFKKLMLHIRLNLKDESRVEAFYEYLKETDSSYKWLENCSIPFIENVIKNERQIPLSLFKRLCRRSAHFLTYHERVDVDNYYEFKTELLFLVKSRPEEYLNFLEKVDCFYMTCQIGRKRTEIIMKTCPQRIFNKFDKYASVVDLSVAAKYLKKEEIKRFILNKEMKENRIFYEFDKLKHFVKNMSEEEKLKFIKQTFIDRTDLTFLRSEDEKEEYKMDLPLYHWYKYLPFNVAFPELRKLILAENSPPERCAMLSVLITCARRDPQHTKTLLQFFFERHINEPFKFKIQFINNLLSQISTHELDLETWDILDKLFHSMEVYTESENNVQMCLEAIVLYNVLHDEPVPEIVEQKMVFNTFEKVRRKLNKDENGKLFSYLLNSAMTKIKTDNISNEPVFAEAKDHFKNVLSLLKDWKKDISKYPCVLKKIQELVQIKQKNLWKVDSSDLYNMKKSWRKHMFEESLSLWLCEEACLNALKHKPQLLTRHDKEIDTLRTNDAVSLRRLLSKLRVYWPHSLAQQWTNAYLLNLNKPTGQKAVIKGLFALLPQNQIIDMAKKYAPDNFKINWGETDQTEISTRKNIAKHLHLARPLIPLDTVLLYAKGDYLQYAVPSLNAIIAKLSIVESRPHVSKLLKAPISLRKIGLHLAFSKLNPSELKSLIMHIWDTTTNSLVKSVIFKNTHAQLCRVQSTTVEKQLWSLLSMIIDKLSLRENKEIFKCLGKIENVPLSVRADFFMKSYAYLISLNDNAWRDKSVNNLLYFVRITPNIVESFHDDFVAEKLLSPAGTKFCVRDSDFIDIFGYFVLWGKTEEDQLRRFRMVIEPAMEEAFLSWRKAHLDDYYVKTNFNQFIQYLTDHYKEFVFSRRTAPAKLFTEIKNKMENKMELLENYALYTSWKLVTVHAQVLEQYVTEMGDAWLTGDKEEIWNEINVAISPTLGPRIVNCLKEDTEQYFPSICLLFSDALQKMIVSMFSYDSELQVQILKHMLNDQDFTPSYVVVSRVTHKNANVSKSFKEIRTEIRKLLKSHPSQEVQIHYYNDFKSLPIDELED